MQSKVSFELFLILFVTASLLIMGTGEGGVSASLSSSPIETPTPTKTPTPVPAADIDILVSSVSPQTVLITMYDTVTWRNKAGAYRLVAENNNRFASGYIAANGTYSSDFNAPGEYPYSVRDASGVVKATGKIIVVNGSVQKVFLPLVIKNYSPGY